jgi:hypothetical protein
VSLLLRLAAFVGVKERVPVPLDATPYFSQRAWMFLIKKHLGFESVPKSLQAAERKSDNAGRQLAPRFRKAEGAHPGGILYRCENTSVAGKAIRKLMKTKGR